MNLSLYIHIPFCVRKCRYCDFASVADAAVTHDEYVAAVVREMEGRAHELPETVAAETLYIGGGTPSLLHPQLVEQLIAQARGLYTLAANAEITLEANPGTVTEASLGGYRAAGVNRLSLGIQSLDDAMLSILGRIHTAGQAMASVAVARAAGFENIGIDLIHSLPGQSLDHWHQTLREAVALRPDHISSYGLTVEDGTPFAEAVEKDELSLPGNDESAAMYEAAMNMLDEAGYEQYEIANFARPGFRSRHNQVYWRRGNYLGFGSGAHSFLRTSGFGQRWSNPPEISGYVETVFSAGLPESRELLSQRDAMSEYCFLGLRLLEGIDPELFRREFGIALTAAYPGILDRHITNGLLLEKNGLISLSRKGVLMANQVFADFA